MAKAPKGGDVRVVRLKCEVTTDEGVMSPGTPIRLPVDQADRLVALYGEVPAPPLAAPADDETGSGDQ